jgi:hypothetical protein
MATDNNNRIWRLIYEAWAVTTNGRVVGSDERTVWMGGFRGKLTDFRKVFGGDSGGI